MAASPGSGLSQLLPAGIMNGVTGVNSTLNNITTSIPQVPQYFFSVPFANNQAVLYKLEIKSNLATSLDQSNSGTTTFIFPLTPSSVTKSVINLTNYYDVQGDNTNNGVQRIIDIYGLTPPIITISGTTGFQFHSLDNYQWSGKSSFALLVQFIQQYAVLVATAANSNQTVQMPVMTFTDGFTGEVFNVIPMSRQAYSMDVSRPILQTYNLQFLAQSSTAPTAVSLTQEDAISQTFLQARIISNSALLSWWQSLLGNVSIGNIT